MGSNDAPLQTAIAEMLQAGEASFKISTDIDPFALESWMRFQAFCEYEDGEKRCPFLAAAERASRDYATGRMREEEERWKGIVAS